MKAFGSVRTYHKCRVLRAGFGRKSVIQVRVKNHKFDRQKPIQIAE